MITTKIYNSMIVLKIIGVAVLLFIFLGLLFIVSLGVVACIEIAEEEARKHENGKDGVSGENSTER